MTTPEPPIDLILKDFFAAERQGAVGLRRGRIDLVEAQLRGFLEREGPRHVCDECRAVLELERQFGPSDAFARYMFPDALVVLLRLFVERSWLPNDVQQRRVELRLVDALSRYLDDYGLFDRREYALRFLELRRSIRAAQAAVRGASVTRRQT